MRLTLPLAGPTKQDRSIQCSASRTINLYPVAKSEESKAPRALYGHPGLKQLANIGIGPHRSNGVVWGGSQYWVSNTELYKLSTSFAGTLIGTLNTNLSRVVMAPGRTYMGMVDGTNGYYTDGSTLTQIADADFPNGSTHIAYLDGFFIAFDPDNDDFYICETTEDITSWLALDFAIANAKPDKIKALIASDRTLFVPGEETTQRYFNSGNPSFPFEPYPNTMSIGIDAPYSLVESAAGVFMLGVLPESPTPMVANILSGRPEIISDEELNYQLSTYSTTSDAIGWMRSQAGQIFYELHFPAAQKTWSCNVSSQPYMWTELKGYGINHFRGASYGAFNKKAIVGDYQDGRLHELDFDVYTEDGNPLVRKRVTRILHNQGLSLSVRSLMLDGESGVGLITGQGSDPQAMLRYSTDGGKTWSAEIWAPLGKVGQQFRKAQWDNLGIGIDWVFEVSVSDPVPFNGWYLHAEIEPGRV